MYFGGGGISTPGVLPINPFEVTADNYAQTGNW
jgi:hypothetical protein